MDKERLNKLLECAADDFADYSSYCTKICSKCSIELDPAFELKEIFAKTPSMFITYIRQLTKNVFELSNSSSKFKILKILITDCKSDVKSGINNEEFGVQFSGQESIIKVENFSSGEELEKSIIEISKKHDVDFKQLGPLKTEILGEYSHTKLNNEHLIDHTYTQHERDITQQSKWNFETGFVEHNCTEGEIYTDLWLVEDSELWKKLKDKCAVVRNDTGGYSFICLICSRSYRFGTHLKRHMITHTDSSYFCSSCKVSFISERNLQNHVLRHKGLSCRQNYNNKIKKKKLVKKAKKPAKQDSDLNYKTPIQKHDYVSLERHNNHAGHEHFDHKFSAEQSPKINFEAVFIKDGFADNKYLNEPPQKRSYIKVYLKSSEIPNNHASHSYVKNEHFEDKCSAGQSPKINFETVFIEGGFANNKYLNELSADDGSNLNFEEDRS